MIYKLLVILHILGATVWVGGHLVIVCTILPRALREKSAQRILDFEKGFVPIGVPAFLIQAATGLWLADHWLGGLQNLAGKPTGAGHLILTKLALLVITIALMGYAHMRILPNLKGDNLRPFVIHAWATTIVAVLMLVVGASVRLGGSLIQRT
jgi:putative copper export protein